MKNLHFIDFFSQTPRLKINNSDRYSTIFGMIISLITILSIFTVAIYYIVTSFSRINYQILERMDNKLVPNTKIFENKISFILADPFGKEFKEPERLFSIDAKFWEITPRNFNGNISEFKNIPVTNCTIYQNEPFEANFNNLMNFYKTPKCLDFKSLEKNLYGKYGSLTG
jgi:hypothetical protein